MIDKKSAALYMVLRFSYYYWRLIAVQDTGLKWRWRVYSLPAPNTQLGCKTVQR
ncbi:MAG: hypothetical protein AVDCRST_MAG95-657 [uncultured Adhaeribacter sp.]|uniref:Uncharacterized protein n=1 Tax=uncultured Adhaeribacter sp. TaxID=448109 RepID=A0A6J4HHV6_9BACT|nr:MAG: hypothetical protein AVDCRST_MAG95-657 [uncultured Adhaeribacter sp.]